MSKIQGPLVKAFQISITQLIANGKLIAKDLLKSLEKTIKFKIDNDNQHVIGLWIILESLAGIQCIMKKNYNS